MASGTARRTDPKLWNKVKARVMRGTKGGEAGEWSARKAQLAVQEYKKAGGGYEGGKSASNHLTQWTQEDWGTKSGRESGKTGERYLPRKAREALTEEEYARTTAAKRRDTAKGKQMSRQPADVARKTAKARTTGKAQAPSTTKRTAPSPAKRQTAAEKARKPASARQRQGAAADRKPPTRRTAAAKAGKAGQAATRKTTAKAAAAPARKAAPRKTPAAPRKSAAPRRPAAGKRSTAKPSAPRTAAARDATSGRATRTKRPAK